MFSLVKCRAKPVLFLRTEWTEMQKEENLAWWYICFVSAHELKVDVFEVAKWIWIRRKTQTWTVFATTTSGNIYFSDVLMVSTNTHYTLWLTTPWFSTKIDFIKWKRMNKKWHWKKKSMFWSLYVSYYLLFKIMPFYYELVLF